MIIEKMGSRMGTEFGQKVNYSTFEIMQTLSGSFTLEEGKIIDGSEAPLDCLERLKDKRIAIVVGGSGTLCRVISDIQSIKYVILVETNESLLSWSFEEGPLKNFDSSKLFICNANNKDELFFDFFNWLRVPERAFCMESDCVVINPHSARPNYDFFDTVKDEWVAAKKQITRHFGEKEDSLLGLKLVSENRGLIETSPGILDLKNSFSGIPAIICSTGPSLEKSLIDLKDLNQKAVILSADASLNILLDAGIKPHFAATIERDLYSKKFFESSSVKQRTQETTLIAYPFIPNEGLKTYKGPLRLVYRDYGYFRYFESSYPKGILSSSSSVAHFCLNIAHYFGCSPIVLVGQDLAYDPYTFASHSKGVAYTEWSKESSLEAMKKRVVTEGLGDVFFVPGNIDEEVPTHSTYFSFMKEFSWEAKRLGARVINATAGGAKIPGIEWRSLKEVSRDWKDVAPGTFQYEIKKNADQSWKTLNEAKNILTEIASRLDQLKLLISDFSSYQAMPNDKKLEILRAIRSAQEELMNNDQFVSFVIQNGGRDILRVENQWNDSEGKSFEERVLILKEWILLNCDIISRVVDSLDQFS